MRRRGETGETLIETLVATALLGIVGIGIIGAIASVLISTEIDRGVSRGETVLRSYVAAIQDAPYSASGAYGGVYEAPRGFTKSLGPVACWDGVSPAAVPASTVALTFGKCDGSGQGLQKVTVSVTSGGSHPTTQAATFVKRSPIPAVPST